MTNGKKPGDDRPEADLEGLARRFQDLWRDQMAAVAADPDFAEMMTKWFGAGSPGAAPGPFTAFPPGMMPGAAGPFGQVDPAAWLKALGIEAPGPAMGGSGKADEQSAATDSPAAGTPSAPAPSGSGDAPGDQFERRLADLEQRLDRLETAIGGAGGKPAKGTRKRRS